MDNRGDLERDRTKKRLQKDDSRREMSSDKEIDKSVKRKTIKDKRAYIDKLAEEAEDGANTGNMRTLYGITKTLPGDFGRSGEGPIKDKTGAVLTSDEDKKARWAEHFHETLSRLPPAEIVDFSIYEETEKQRPCRSI